MNPLRLVNQFLSLTFAALRDFLPSIVREVTQTLTGSEQFSLQQLDTLDYQLDLPIQLLVCPPLADVAVASIVKPLENFAKFVQILGLQHLSGTPLQTQVMALVTSYSYRLVYIEYECLKFTCCNCRI